FVQRVHVRHAVQHRDHRRTWTDRGGDVVDRRRQRGGLHRDEDDVVVAVDLGGGEQPWREYGRGPEAGDPQTALAEHVGAFGPHEEGDVPTGLLELGAEVASGRA